MKILHVITGLNNGGAEGALCRLVTADRTNSHEVVSMMDAGVFRDRLAQAAVPVHALSMSRGWPTYGGLKEIYRLIREIEPDVVQTWMYHADLVGGVIARLAGRREVAWGVRASDAHEHTRNISARALVYLGAALSRIVPVRIVFVSLTGAEVHRAAGYCASKSRIVPNGYDTEMLAPDRERRERQRAEWQIGPGTPLIGMVARWDPLKDHDTLFAALQRLRTYATEPWECVLVGPGMTDTNHPLVSLLRDYALRGQVRLAGPLRDISSVMNALDIHLLSSKSEAFPNVLAEAMACATPCITTNVGDAALIVGATGWIVPSSDSVAFANALREALSLMRDVEAWGHRKTSCRARILSNFSMSRMVASYSAVWAEVANRHA